MPVVYSHSRLSLFDGCRLRYRLKYIDRVRRDIEGVEAFLGLRVHESLEYLYRDLLQGRTTSEEDLVAGFHRRWEERWHDAIVVVDPAVTPEALRAVGEVCLRRYHARHTPFRSDQTLGVEVKIAVDLPGGARLEGYADRIARDPDGWLSIHDYKTSATLPTQADVDEDRQLALYQAGTARLWPDAPGVRLVWHYLRFDERLVSVRSRPRMDALLQETADRIRTVESEQRWEPTATRLCSWCPYWDLCPERKHEWALTHPGAEVPSLLPSERPGAEVASRLVESALAAEEALLAAGRELAAVRARLIEYARSTGATRVVAPGGWARVEPAPESLPAVGEPGHPRLRAAVIAAGLHAEFAELDTDRLLQAWRGGRLPEDLASTIEQLVRRNETARVVLHRPEGDRPAAS